LSGAGFRGTVPSFLGCCGCGQVALCGPSRAQFRAQSSDHLRRAAPLGGGQPTRDIFGYLIRRAEVSLPKHQQKSVEEGYAFYIDALAQLGRMWKQAPKQAGGRGRKGGGRSPCGIGATHKAPQFGVPPTREDLGLTEKTLKVAVALAELPAEQER
jgi:hypothetical protein